MTIQIKGAGEECRSFARCLSRAVEMIMSREDESLPLPQVELQVNLLKWEAIES